jgi:hypothetical protein
MDDGRQILAELQARGVADRDLDYDDVMAELAGGRHAMSVIGPHRRGAQFVVSLKVGERQLIDDLTAVARGPLWAMVWPAAPPIPFGRLTVDFERTTGRALKLGLRWEQYSDDGIWLCDISIDDKTLGSSGVGWDEDDPESCLVALADSACENWLHEAVWGGWPMCPHHPSRPMWATLNRDTLASWRCEADARHQVLIGQLGL